MANYLYNGIELPPLPERNLYYATIGIGGNDYRLLFLYSEPLTYFTGLLATEGMGYVYKHNETTGAWEEIDDWGFPGSNFPSSEWTITTLEWTNIDIWGREALVGDNEIMLAASYPINAETGEEIKDYVPIPITAPALDPLSLFLGWKAGNWVARQRGKKAEKPEEEKTPVAYLYNGVRLPGLPNHSEYPYVMLDWQGEGYTKRLWVNSEPIHKGSLFWSIPAGSSGILYGLNEANEWEQGDYWNADKDPFGVPMTPYWANYDVLNKDGTVYLAASEPVPVYE